MGWGKTNETIEANAKRHHVLPQLRAMLWQYKNSFAVSLYLAGLLSLTSMVLVLASFRIRNPWKPHGDRYQPSGAIDHQASRVSVCKRVPQKPII
jgi:hypothetical protein